MPVQFWSLQVWEILGLGQLHVVEKKCQLSVVVVVAFLVDPKRMSLLAIWELQRLT